MDRRTVSERYLEARRRLATLPSGYISESDIGYAVDEILSVLDCVESPVMKVTKQKVLILDDISEGLTTAYIPGIIAWMRGLKHPSLTVTKEGATVTVTNQGGSSMFDEAEALAATIGEDHGKLYEALEDGDGDEAIVIASRLQLTVRSLLTELHSLPITADVGEPEPEE